MRRLTNNKGDFERLQPGSDNFSLAISFRHGPLEVYLEEGHNIMRLEGAEYTLVSESCVMLDLQLQVCDEGIG